MHYIISVVMHYRGALTFRQAISSPTQGDTRELMLFIILLRVNEAVK